jgi:hypothetical protein
MLGEAAPQLALAPFSQRHTLNRPVSIVLTH